MSGSLTVVRGFRVGHWTDERALTGCTVILCPPGTVGGASLRGFATGTRGAETLGPLHTTPHVDAVLLSGGSAFGLDAARGVMRFLEEEGRGYRVGPAVVPIVAAAILFDLAAGDPRVRPGPDEGYAACRAASRERVAEGSVGAGAGCTAGKLHGMPQATKTGLGSAALTTADGLAVGALAAVNAFGDVIDPATGLVVAGLRESPTSHRFAGMAARIAAGETRATPATENTTLAVVATNARLDKAGACRLADQVHDAFARAILPAHTAYDGDVVFVLATGAVECDATRLQALAADLATEAVLRGAREATSLGGIPAARDLAGQ